MNPFHKAIVFEVDFNTLLPSTPWSSKWSLSFMIYYQKSLRISFFAIRAIYPAHLIFLVFLIRIIYCEKKAVTPPSMPKHFANKRSNDVSHGRFTWRWRFIFQYSGSLYVPDYTVSSLRRPYSKWWQFRFCFKIYPLLCMVTKPCFWLPQNSTQAAVEWVYDGLLRRKLGLQAQQLAGVERDLQYPVCRAAGHRGVPYC